MLLKLTTTLKLDVTKDGITSTLIGSVSKALAKEGAYHGDRNICCFKGHRMEYNTSQVEYIDCIFCWRSVPFGLDNDSYLEC